MTFEERLDKLEQVVERLERGELSLEDSVQLFDEGVTLSNACKEELDRAEGRIEVLTRGRGGLVSAPLQITEESEGGEEEEEIVEELFGEE